MVVINIGNGGNLSDLQQVKHDRSLVFHSKGAVGGRQGTSPEARWDSMCIYIYIYIYITRIHLIPIRLQPIRHLWNMLPCEEAASQEMTRKASFPIYMNLKPSIEHQKTYVCCLFGKTWKISDYRSMCVSLLGLPTHMGICIATQNRLSVNVR